MNKDEFLESIKTLGTCEDDVERRTILADLSEKVSSVFDSHDSYKDLYEKSNADNEKLREANMKLFLKVGDEKEPATQVTPQEPQKQELKFEDLFDEKGMLK